jgi:hypothetical protein
MPAPALLEPAVAMVGLLLDHGGLTGLSALQLPARPIRLAVMPGSLDQQPAGMAVAGLGDRPLDALGTAGVLGWDQPELGADGGPVKRCQSLISTASPLPRRPVPGATAASTADGAPASDPHERLPRPDQVPGGLLSLGRHPHLGELPDVQQPGQAFGVAPVGLDPIA